MDDSWIERGRKRRSNTFACGRPYTTAEPLLSPVLRTLTPVAG